MMVILSNPITGTIDNFLDIAMAIVMVMMIYYFIRFFMVSPPTEEERKKQREEEEQQRQQSKEWWSEKFKKAQDRKKKEEEDKKESVNKERRYNHIRKPYSELVKVKLITDPLHHKFDLIAGNDKPDIKKRKAVLESTTKSLEELHEHILNANKYFKRLNSVDYTFFDYLWKMTGNPLRLVEYLQKEIKTYQSKGYPGGKERTDLIALIKNEAGDIQTQTGVITEKVQKYHKEGDTSI